MRVSFMSPVFGAFYGIGKFSIFNATTRYALIYAANFAAN